MGKNVKIHENRWKLSKRWSKKWSFSANLGQNQAKIRQNEAKCGPGLATVRSQWGHSVVPDWPQWEIQWGNSGEEDPDPYHGVVPRSAPCSVPTTPGTHPPPPTRLHGTSPSTNVVEAVHQASFGYSVVTKTVVLSENHCFVWKSLFFPFSACAEPLSPIRFWAPSEPITRKMGKKCRKWSKSRKITKKCLIFVIFVIFVNFRTPQP